MIKYHLGSSLPSFSFVPFFLEHLSTSIGTFAMLQLVINVDYNSLQEAQLISVDSLGFDVRVCSGTQVQTLRFGFKKRVHQLFFIATYLNAYIFYMALLMPCTIHPNTNTSYVKMRAT